VIHLQNKPNNKKLIPHITNVFSITSGVYSSEIDIPANTQVEIGTLQGRNGLIIHNYSDKVIFLGGDG
jgi:hypothetical protein